LSFQHSKPLHTSDPFHSSGFACILSQEIQKSTDIIRVDP